jgi:hypothetical protein
MMDTLTQHLRSARFRVGLVVLFVLLMPGCVYASPFGQGVFGADVPFGADTSLSIDLGSDVNLALSQSGSFYEGTGSHTVTVTSTDVVGYNLYVHALGTTDLTNGTVSIPASNNTSAAPLITNTWGYNTTGSTTDFIGMTTASTPIKQATGPFKDGDPTTVTYGAKTDVTQAAGAYQANIVYTAVAANP